VALHRRHRGAGTGGALLGRVSAAKAYAAGAGKPLYGVNHLAGHVAADTLEHGRCLAVPRAAGVRRALVAAARRGPRRQDTEIGATIDDAAGEAYEQSGQGPRPALPGGPRRQNWPSRANGCAIAFPRGLTGPRTRSTTFPSPASKPRWPAGWNTGKGTAFRCAGRCRRLVPGGRRRRGFTAKAIKAAKKLGVDTLVISGGVAANSRLSSLAASAVRQRVSTCGCRTPRLCTTTAR